MANMDYYIDYVVCQSNSSKYGGFQEQAENKTYKLGEKKIYTSGIKQSYISPAILNLDISIKPFLPITTSKDISVGPRRDESIPAAIDGSEDIPSRYVDTSSKFKGQETTRKILATNNSPVLIDDLNDDEDRPSSRKMRNRPIWKVQENNSVDPEGGLETDPLASPTKIEFSDLSKPVKPVEGKNVKSAEDRRQDPRIITRDANVSAPIFDDKIDRLEASFLKEKTGPEMMNHLHNVEKNPVQVSENSSNEIYDRKTPDEKLTSYDDILRSSEDNIFILKKKTAFEESVADLFVSVPSVEHRRMAVDVDMSRREMSERDLILKQIPDLDVAKDLVSSGPAKNDSFVDVGLISEKEFDFLEISDISLLNKQKENGKMTTTKNKPQNLRVNADDDILLNCNSKEADKPNEWMTHIFHSLPIQDDRHLSGKLSTINITDYLLTEISTKVASSAISIDRTNISDNSSAGKEAERSGSGTAIDDGEGGWLLSNDSKALYDVFADYVAVDDRVALVTSPDRVALVTSPDRVALVTSPDRVALVTSPDLVAIVTTPDRDLEEEEEYNSYSEETEVVTYRLWTFREVYSSCDVAAEFLCERNELAKLAVRKWVVKKIFLGSNSQKVRYILKWSVDSTFEYTCTEEEYLNNFHLAIQNFAHNRHMVQFKISFTDPNHIDRVHWLKDGRTINLNDRKFSIKNSRENNVCTLDIADVCANDAGVYTLKII